MSERKTIFTVAERLTQALERKTVLEGIVRKNMPAVDMATLKRPSNKLRKRDAYLAYKIDDLFAVHYEIRDLLARESDETAE